MNLIRYLDFFNIKFQFYYENRLKVNIFGGIMTLSCIICCIIVSIILAIVFVKKKESLFKYFISLSLFIFMQTVL